MQVYGTSKLYTIMAAKALNETLKGSGVECFAAHPGADQGLCSLDIDPQSSCYLDSQLDGLAVVF